MVFLWFFIAIFGNTTKLLCKVRKYVKNVKLKTNKLPIVADNILLKLFVTNKQTTNNSNAINNCNCKSNLIGIM